MSTKATLVGCGLGAVIAAIGGALGLAQLRQRIAMEEHRVSTLRSALASTETQAAAQQQAVRAAQDKLDMIEAEIAVELKYGPPPANVWAERVSRLKARLAQSPDGKIPELALLQPKDWIDAAVRAEGADEKKIKAVLAAVCRTARARLGEKLHDALVKFVAQSHDQLPTDPRQLLPYADAAVTEPMLAGYAFARTGDVGAKDEKVLQRKLGNDVYSVSLDGSSYNSNTTTNNVDDAGELLSGLAEDPAMRGVGQFAETLRRAATAIQPIMDTAFSGTDMEVFSQKLKESVKQYQANNNGGYPATFADLSSYLGEDATVAHLFRSFFANLNYAIEHDGNLPSDTAHLQRYLDAWTDQRVLSRLVIKADKSGFTMSFNLKE